jgi:hypothetical protein
MTRSRFLLAVCLNMQWRNAGLFQSEQEAEREQRVVVTLGESATRIIRLRGRG